MRAGMLRERVTFERRTAADDGHGNAVAEPWVALFTDWATLGQTRGREQIARGPLESQVTGVLQVRASSLTRTVTAADSAVISGVRWNIRTIIETPRHDMIEMTVERGVAG